jgi:ligand-binding SRPBCC domain-containing protein
MITFDKTVVIERPPEQVFEFVSDPANDALYRSGAQVAAWASEGPIGVGSRMQSVDHFLGREVVTWSEITQWDPPNAYAFETVTGSFPSRFALTFRPRAGGTEVNIQGEMTFRGLAKVIEWIFGGQIKTQAKRDFDNLKRVLEQRQEAGAP